MANMQWALTKSYGTKRAAIVLVHGAGAVEFANAGVESSAADIRVQARWVLIRRRIIQIMEAATKDARQ